MEQQLLLRIDPQKQVQNIIKLKKEELPVVKVKVEVLEQVRNVD